MEDKQMVKVGEQYVSTRPSHARYGETVTITHVTMDRSRIIYRYEGEEGHNDMAPSWFDRFFSGKDK